MKLSSSILFGTTLLLSSPRSAATPLEIRGLAVLLSLEGDQLEQLHTSDGQYGIYDCSRNETIVLGSSDSSTQSPSQAPTETASESPTVASTNSPSSQPSASTSAAPSYPISAAPSDPVTAAPSDPITVAPSEPVTAAPSDSPLPLSYLGENLEGTGYQYGLCEGDCDSSGDCDWGLNCFFRNGFDAVPGCTSGGTGDVNGKDYCYKPAPGVMVIAGDEDEPPSAYPLQRCEGDCDEDFDCDGDMVCLQRDSGVPVPECEGSPRSNYDYCISRASPNYLIYKYNDYEPTSSNNYPLGECEGDCDDSDDCANGLICYKRSGADIVPGCVGNERESGRDFCVKDPTLDTDFQCPTASPVPITTAPAVGNPVPNDVTYRPGENTVIMNGLRLSTGLSARVIATTGQPVPFDNSNEVSTHPFHTVPDGAGVFVDEETGGWVYVTNSEDSDIQKGGVGAIYFDAQGRVVGYERLLGLGSSFPQTRRNCGGGKTYWDTWLTCEEHDDGEVWEVDPWTGATKSHATIVGPLGMNYEAAAYDNRVPSDPKFFATVDEGSGPLVRFTPDPVKVQPCVDDYNANGGVYSQASCSGMLYDQDGGGDPSLGNHAYHYFKVESVGVCDDGILHGIYSWTDDIEEGRASASAYHVSGEGIDVKDGQLFYTTKSSKFLFIIDLDPDDQGLLRFTRTSTKSGAFDGQPDQVARVLNFATGATDGILYFCEDGGTGDKHGVHGRDSNGKYFTILEDASDVFNGETTGLAFAPNGMFMYVSFQGPGLIYEITRDDGYPFYGAALEIMHHMAPDDSSPFLRERNLFANNAKTCELVLDMCMD